MEKMKRGQVYTLAFGAAAITEATSLLCAINGIAAFGTIMTGSIIGMLEKHPFITGLLSGAASAIISGTIVESDVVGDMITKSSTRFAKNVTDLFYGPSDEEEVTED